MKKVIFKLGLGIVALMGLTSFNPFSEQLRLAQIEGSTTYAATAPATPQIPYQRSLGGWIGSPGFGFKSDTGKQYRISEIKYSSATTSPDAWDLDSLGAKSTTTQTVEICIEEVSSTEATVCVEGTCSHISKKCGPVDIRIEDLEKGNREVLNIINVEAKNILKNEKERLKKELVAKKSKEKDCDFKTADGKNDNEAILECARENYDTYGDDDRKARIKYAKIAKKAVMAMARDSDTDPEDIRNLIEDLDVTSREPELYKSIMAAYKYSRFMQPTMYAYDYQEREFKSVNIPEYYQLQLDGIMQQAVDSETYYGVRVDPQILSDKIKTLNRQYQMTLTSSLGQPSSDPWGITSDDYRNLLSDYMDSMPMITGLGGNPMFTETYDDLNSLMYPSTFNNRFSRSGGTRQDFSGRNFRTSDNILLDSSNCYDSVMASNTRCGNSRGLDNLGTGARGRGGLRNYDAWLDAAQNVSSTRSSSEFGFFN